MAVCQRLCLHRQGNCLDGRRTQPTAADYAGALAVEQRHCGGAREDAQARLRPPRHLSRRRSRDAAPASLVRGLELHHLHSGLRMLSTKSSSAGVPEPTPLPALSNSVQSTGWLIALRMSRLLHAHSLPLAPAVTGWHR